MPNPYDLGGIELQGVVTIAIVLLYFFTSENSEEMTFCGRISDVDVNGGFSPLSKSFSNKKS